jgi:hypothetical protein
MQDVIPRAVNSPLRWRVCRCAPGTMCLYVPQFSSNTGSPSEETSVATVAGNEAPGRYLVASSSSRRALQPSSPLLSAKNAEDQVLPGSICGWLSDGTFLEATQDARQPSQAFALVFRYALWLAHMGGESDGDSVDWAGDVLGDMVANQTGRQPFTRHLAGPWGRHIGLFSQRCFHPVAQCSKFVA